MAVAVGAGVQATGLRAYRRVRGCAKRPAWNGWRHQGPGPSGARIGATPSVSVDLGERQRAAVVIAAPGRVTSAPSGATDWDVFRATGVAI